MFTKNYIEYKKLCFAGLNSVHVKDMDGVSRSVYLDTSPWADIGYNMRTARCMEIPKTTSNYYYSTTYMYSGTYFGTGATPATADDYCLESPITSGLSITNPTALAWVDGGSGRYEAVADIVVRNTSSAEINIYEVGVFGVMSSSSNTNNVGNLYNILMERTVLTEPINIQPGESKLVTYKITFNQTLNVE